MKIDKRQIDQLIRGKGRAYRMALFYGPDEGLIRERARALASSITDNTDDPFRLVDVREGDILANPGRLVDEIRSIAMTGGRKCIRIDASDAITPVLGSILAEAPLPGEGFVVLSGGDLGSRSSLRKLADQTELCASIACYRDSVGDIGALIRDQLKEAGKRIDSNALTYIVQHLGDDRAVTRAEIDKLVLYVGLDTDAITLDDATAIIGDRNAFGLDDYLFALTDGDDKNVEKFLDLNLGEELPMTILRSLGRHLVRLHLASSRLARGEKSAAITASLRPPLFWATKPRFERQMQSLRPDLIARLLDRVGAAEALLLGHYAMGELIVRQLSYELVSTIKAAVRR